LELLGFGRSLFEYDFTAKRRPKARELLAMKLKVPAPVGIRHTFGIKSLRVIQQTIVRSSERPEAWREASLDESRASPPLNIKDGIFNLSIGFMNAGHAGLVSDLALLAGIFDSPVVIGMETSYREWYQESP